MNSGLQVYNEQNKLAQWAQTVAQWAQTVAQCRDSGLRVRQWCQEHGVNPKEFLSGFKGYLHTDGYAGYHDLGEGITVVGCWAHARRKFDEAVKSLPKGKGRAEQLWDAEKGFYISGDKKQISWASQVWMPLGSAKQAVAVPS